MNKDSTEKFEEYLKHYKSAHVIWGEYSFGSVSYKISLEVRQGATNGCTLFTIIDGTTYRITSKLIRGCLYKLLSELPKGSIITIPHKIYVEEERQRKQITVYEELSSEFTEDVSSEGGQIRKILILLGCEVNNNDIHTKHYESDEPYEALDELKSLLEWNKPIFLRICPYCRFYENYANSSICLRDLSQIEYAQVQELIKKRMDLQGYYEKIAWDLDVFHFCDAFLGND
jgi:hypothetical protein